MRLPNHREPLIGFSWWCVLVFTLSSLSELLSVSRHERFAVEVNIVHDLGVLQTEFQHLVHHGAAKEYDVRSQRVQSKTRQILLLSLLPILPN